MDRLLWWTKWKNQSSERRKTCLKLSREPKPHITTGFTLQLCVYSHFLCVYSIFADLLLGSSFLHLWMMFSLPNFLPINTFHDLTFDKIILSPFSPFFFFWLQRIAFSMLLVSKISLWPLKKSWWYCTSSISLLQCGLVEKVLGWGLSLCSTTRLKALGDLNFATPSFFLSLKWD